MCQVHTFPSFKSNYKIYWPQIKLPYLSTWEKQRKWQHRLIILQLHFYKHFSQQLRRMPVCLSPPLSTVRAKSLHSSEPVPRGSQGEHPGGRGPRNPSPGPDAGAPRAHMPQEVHTPPPPRVRMQECVCTRVCV